MRKRNILYLATTGLFMLAWATSRGQGAIIELEGPAAAAQEDSTCGVLFLGTSLTSGFGLENPKDGYVGVIEKEIVRQGKNYPVINGGEAGDQTPRFLQRLGEDLAATRPKPRIVAIEIGVNDMLMGKPADLYGPMMNAVIDTVEARIPEAQVLLIGIEPGMGKWLMSNGYNASLYVEALRDIAHKRHIPLVPDLMKGVKFKKAMTQSDGSHPNERGARVMAGNVLPVLAPLMTHLGCPIEPSRRTGEEKQRETK